MITKIEDITEVYQSMICLDTADILISTDCNAVEIMETIEKQLIEVNEDVYHWENIQKLLAENNTSDLISHADWECVWGNVRVIYND